MNYFTYNITVSSKSALLKDDQYFSRFSDAEYIQVNSGKFNKLGLCQDKAAQLLKHLIARENRSDSVVIVFKVNPRLVAVPDQITNSSTWHKNTIMKLMVVDAAELKKEKRLIYTVSGLIESAQPLSQEEFDVYFSSK